MNLKKIISSVVALLAASSASANIPSQVQTEEDTSESVLLLPENTEVTLEEEKAILELLEEIGVKVKIRRGNMLLMSKQGVTGDGDGSER